MVWSWRSLAAGSTSVPCPAFAGVETGQRFPLFLKRRESIARKNIELCFPQYNAEEREKLIAENFKSIGMALLETGMAWFWPDERVRKWFDVEGWITLNARRCKNAA
jgi:KDO2-lipid IV(A) palmitoleoyltransferase